MNHPEPHRPRPAWSETPTEALPLPPHTQQLPVTRRPEEEPEPARRRPRGLVLGIAVLALAGFAAFGVSLGTGTSYDGQSAGPAPSTVSEPAATAAPQTTTPSTTDVTPDDTTPDDTTPDDTVAAPDAARPAGPAAGPAAGGPGAGAPGAGGPAGGTPVAPGAGVAPAGPRG